jgi:hypothetical protein
MTWGDVEANVEEEVGGGGIDTLYKPWLPVVVRDIVCGFNERAPKDALTRGEDGRLCVDWDGAEVGGETGVCVIEGLGDVLWSEEETLVSSVLTFLSRGQKANLRARRQDATPHIILPVPVQLGIGFDGSSARATNKRLKVHTSSGSGSINSTIECRGRAVFYALRIAQELIMLLFDSIPKLLYNSHEALKLFDI